jgi:hypothetical protein
MCGAPTPVNTSDRKINTILGPLDNPNFVATNQEVFDRNRSERRLTQLPFLPPPAAEQGAQFIGTAQMHTRDVDGRAIDRRRRGAAGLRITRTA